MTITKTLTAVAFAATFALAAAPAHAQAHRGGAGRSVGRGVIRGGVVVRGGGGFYRPYYARPYYSFRPRVSLGFGLWVGYPVRYPYYYDYPYGYGYPYPYPYPVDPYAYGSVAPSYGYPAQPYGSPNQNYPSSNYPSSNYPPSNYPPSTDPRYGSSDPRYPAQQPGPSISAQRGQQSRLGGVSFEITPDTAAIFVDGDYVGTAGEFGPQTAPMDLESGRHHIEIRARGYHTMTFDVDVAPGEVIPYKGTLQRD